MFKFLAEFIGSVIVFAALYLVALFLMKVSINAIVSFVLWTAEVMGMEYK